MILDTLQRALEAAVLRGEPVRIDLHPADGDAFVAALGPAAPGGTWRALPAALRIDPDERWFPRLTFNGVPIATAPSVPRGAPRVRCATQETR